jgi:hypothetical protein
MGLTLDQFAAASVRKGPGCTVGLLLGALPPSEAEVLAAVLAAGEVEYPHAVVSRVLKEQGHRIERSTIARHRRGECACGT